MVGRAEEMAWLAAALERAAAGQGGAVFLAGGPGLGKTRLCQEALALARARGFLALEARASPLEGGLAYAPVAEAFGPVLRGQDAARLARLTGGLPDLGRLFGGLHLPVPPPLGDPGLEKTRLFEAVARLLERLAREAPVALFFDDLHWADPATLEVVHYLVRGLGAQRVLVTGTYRTDEDEAARGPRRLLYSLRRAGLAEERVVPRLDPDDAAALARALLDEEAPAELLALLESRARGTPLYVETLVAALVDAGQLVRGEGGWSLGPTAGATIPPLVRDLVLERLDRLPASARRVLELVAACEGAAPHAVLAAASELGDEALTAALGQLRAAGLVDEELVDGGPAYATSHPLVQEVACAELAPLAGVRAHAALARALERHRPGDLESLARHYRGAGPRAEPGRALEVLLAAGERARALHAPESAARHFEAALRIVRDGRRDLLPAVLERLAEAWDGLGEAGAAVALWAEAVVEHERAGDALGVARLHRSIAAAEWDRGRFEESRQHLAAGLAALAGRPPSPELADLLHVRVNSLKRGGELDVLPAAAAELRAAAERLGSPRALAEAHLAEVDLHDLRGELRAARETARLALAAAEAAAAPLLAYRARDVLMVASVALGDHRAGRACAERNLEIARSLGTPTLEVRPCAHLGMSDLEGGDWDGALRHSARAAALARRVSPGRGLVLALIVRAMVLTRRGDLAGAAACVAEARAAYGERPVADRHAATGVDMADAMLALEQGDAARARVLVVPFAGSVSAGLLPLAPSLLAEAQVAAGEPVAALAVARALAAVDGGAPYTAAAAARLEGLARSVLGEHAAALACLERAGTAFAALELPFEAARARMEWAALATTSDPSAAQTALTESLAAFERLGAGRYADRTRRLLRELGVRPPAPRRSRPTGGALSARELEVARLVADRLTNAEIASRLVLSPRTVTTHLERIYARLGIGSRGELARYVVAAGLVAATGEIA